MSKHIVVENARQNNLRNLDLKLPHGELIVITGVSGSGKSTLAFDTIYAEGQRRYVETFSPYARQFLDRMDKPQVDRIAGIPPAIAIDQTNPVRTSRSTVGTMTELNDHIKLLFARTAALYCRGCGEPVRRDTPENVAARFLDAEGAAEVRVMITFEVPVPENFDAAEIEDWLARQGYTRTYRAGEGGAAGGGKEAGGTISVVQDRLRTDEGNRGRFVEAVEAALRYGQGKVTVHVLGEDREPRSSETFSTQLACDACAIRYREPLPSAFSFNSPMGACESCRGFGRIIGIDYRLAIPDTSLSLKGGAVKVFQTDSAAVCQRDMARAAKRAGVPMGVPFAELSDAQREWVVQGEPSGENGDGGKGGKNRWYGVKGFFEWLESKAYRMHVRVMLAKYRSYDECPDCRGARLKPESLAWRVGTLEEASAVIAPRERHRAVGSTIPDERFDTLPGLDIVDLMQLPLERAFAFVERIGAREVDEATRMVVDEMRSRLAYLADVGLGYLTLDRQSRTLSGGEVQRINLTTALGTSLVNTLFVLDEPSIGLHARDMDRVIRVLTRLRDAGNTLIVVEHDPQLMLAADRIIDIGPGPGAAGGNVVFNGAPAKLLGRKKSLTAQYLTGVKTLSFGTKDERTEATFREESSAGAPLPSGGTTGSGTQTSAGKSGRASRQVGQVGRGKWRSV